MRRSPASDETLIFGKFPSHFSPLKNWVSAMVVADLKNLPCKLLTIND